MNDAPLVSGMFGFLSDRESWRDMQKNFNDLGSAFVAGVPGLPGDLADMAGQATGMFRVPSNWRSEGMQRALGGDPENVSSIVGGMLSPGPGDLAHLPLALGSMLPVRKSMKNGMEWLTRAHDMFVAGAPPEEIWRKTGMLRVGRGNQAVWYKEIPGDDIIDWKNPMAHDILSNSPGQEFPVTSMIELPPQLTELAPVIKNTNIKGMVFDNPNDVGSIGLLKRYGDERWLNPEPDVQMNTLSRVWNRDPLAIVAHELAGHAVEASNPAYRALQDSGDDITKFGGMFGVNETVAKDAAKQYRDWNHAAREMEKAQEFLTLRRNIGEDDIREMYGDDWVQDALQAVDNMEQAYFEGKRVSSTSLGRQRLMETVNINYPKIKGKADQLYQTWKDTTPLKLYNNSLGETFARGVENRRAMTTAERRDVPFWHTIPSPVMGEKAGVQSYDDFLNKLILIPDNTRSLPHQRPYWTRGLDTELTNPLLLGTGDFLPY